MANELTTPVVNPVVRLIKNDGIQKMVEERLGKRSGQFTTSLISLVNANPKIAECTPITVIQAALTAASMDLPINQNLGFAYIVPYKNNKKVDGEWVTTMEAQFQMGWKGFVQLAQRSGAFKTINTTDVREGEVSSRDRMTGELKFVWSDDDEERGKMPVIGYLAYFELLNGFSKSLYMTKAEVEAHAGRYSQAYKSRDSSKFKSPWETDFDLMAQKTALKLLLSKFAPLSTEMQEAIAVDQSVSDGNSRIYIDNDDLAGEKATDEKRAAIVAAHTESNPEASEADTDQPTGDQEQAELVSEDNAPAPKPAKPAKSVAERGKEFAERGKAANAERAKATDDSSSPGTAG